MKKTVAVENSILAHGSSGWSCERGTEACHNCESASIMISPGGSLLDCLPPEGVHDEPRQGHSISRATFFPGAQSERERSVVRGISAFVRELTGQLRIANGKCAECMEHFGKSTAIRNGQAWARLPCSMPVCRPR